MKQKAFIILALALLLALILFMVKDLFYNSPEKKTNPYAYDLRTLKKGDTTQTAYIETRQVHTRLPEIHGLATGINDWIYLAGDNGVEIYDQAGILKNRFDITGNAGCVAVDKHGNIWLGMEDHIEIRNASGKQIKTWKSFGEESFISSIAVTDSFAFIADAGRKVVYRCDLSGNMINRIGEKDPVRKIPGFIIPSPYFDLAIAPDRSLWVVNPGRYELEKYSYDGSFLTSWGEPGIGIGRFCGCCNPSHFTLLRDGSFITSEKGIERIKIYSAEGKFSAVVAFPSSFEEGTRGLDLATDSRERILALDPVKKQVRIFIRKKDQKSN
ncbi:MAG: hypothetical protein M0P58_03950 [Bacteroidales bacterium]|nr:hypothetical protein [Bacteroidales bacterium]